MTEHVSSLPMDMAKASPYIIYVASGLATVISKDPLWPLSFTLGAMVLGDGLNGLLKGAFKAAAGDAKALQRPNPPATGCGIFGRCRVGGKPTFGFPSGHAQITSFSAMFWSLYLARKAEYKGWHLAWRVSILWTLAILVWWSRVALGCHNWWPQITGGVVIGSGIGAGYYFLVEYLMKHKANVGYLCGALTALILMGILGVVGRKRLKNR